MKKKNQQEENNKKEESNEPSVFGGNTDVKVTRDYSLGQLLKSRKYYYLLCFALVAVSATSVGITYGLRDRRSFDDAVYSTFRVTDASKQFNMFDDTPDSEGNIDNDYYLYYYSSSCSACETLSPVIFNYIDTMATHSDPIILYFAQVETLYNADNFSSVGSYSIDQYKQHLIGANDSDDLTTVFNNTLYTPTLFRIRNGAVKDVYVGVNDIDNELDLRDYNQYSHIDTRNSQLDQASQSYYIYYYDSENDSRDFRKQILDYINLSSHETLYFADAFTLEVIEEDFNTDTIIGTTQSAQIRVPYAPYMLKVENRTVTNAYKTVAEISTELGIN